MGLDRSPTSGAMFEGVGFDLDDGGRGLRDAMTTPGGGPRQRVHQGSTTCGSWTVVPGGVGGDGPPGPVQVEGQPLARAPPASAAARSPESCTTVEIGPWRTQRGRRYAIYQVVEIAIFLSPAVNDTFTGMVCADWLGRRSSNGSGAGPQRRLSGADGRGSVPAAPAVRAGGARVRLIRQAGAANPAISIRLLDVIATTAITCPSTAALRAADQVLAGASPHAPIGQDART